MGNFRNEPDLKKSPPAIWYSWLKSWWKCDEMCLCACDHRRPIFFPTIHIHTPFFILFKSRLIYELSSLLLLCCYRHLLLPFCDFTILIIIIVILIMLPLEILAPMVKSGKKPQQYLIQFWNKNNSYIRTTYTWSMFLCTYFIYHLHQCIFKLQGNRKSSWSTWMNFQKYEQGHSSYILCIKAF